MPNVIKTHIAVNVNGANAVQGMNQVSNATKKMGNSFSRAQQISQNLVFAVDDAVQTFGTGGLAGALRGAGNNLTLVAGLLGGLKVQLAAVAAIGVGQFLASQFSRASKAAKDLKKDVVDLGNSLRATLRERQEQQAQDAFRLQKTEIQSEQKLAELSEKTGQERIDATRKAIQEATKEKNAIDERADALASERDAVRKNAEDLQRRIRAEEATQSLLEPPAKPERGVQNLFGLTRLWSSAFSAENAARQERMKASVQLEQQLRKEDIAEGKRLSKLQKQVQAEDELANTIHRRIDALKSALREAEQEKLNKPLFGPEELDLSGERAKEITREVGALRNRLAEMAKITAQQAFSMFPQANAFGSSGAVSTINAARFGSQNIQDAGLRKDDERNRILSDIKRLLDEKRIIGEVIGLN